MRRRGLEPFDEGKATQVIFQGEGEGRAGMGSGLRSFRGDVEEKSGGEEEMRCREGMRSRERGRRRRRRRINVRVHKYIPS